MKAKGASSAAANPSLLRPSAEEMEMSEEFPEELIERIEQCQVLATFSLDNPSNAVPLVSALVEGGIRGIEFTLRTSSAMDSVRALCGSVPETIVGVGTILTPDQAHEVKDAGAAFGVAPGFNRRVVEAAREAGLPFAPGISTPTELEAAIESGCRFVKFFPAEPSGGIRYLRSMSAPYRHLGIRFLPLGGVNSDNMLDYLGEPNVLAVGGTWIVNKEVVDAQDWPGITSRAREVCQILAEAT